MRQQMAHFEKITVAEIMLRNALCIRAEARISDAIEAIMNSSQDCYPVVDQSGACRGIVTLLDLLRSCMPIQEGDDYPDLSALFAEKVDELTNHGLMAAVSPRDNISDTVLLMMKSQTHCLPVQEDGRYLGIIHLREIVRLMP